MDKKVEVELSKPLDRSHVSVRQQSGMSLSYIEGHHAIREANRIFGFDGWSYSIHSLSLTDCGKNTKGNHIVSAQAIVIVSAIGVTRQDVGYGTGIGRDIASANESAGKEAVTDAMKRALRTFGDPFGNALYDKQQKHVADVLDDSIIDSINSAETIETLREIWQTKCNGDTRYTALINQKKKELGNA